MMQSPYQHEFTPAALAEQKATVQTAFQTIHEEQGYEPMAEAPPFPSPDPTVLFVGAQISRWKPFIDRIADGEMAPVYCPQDCIRLQNRDIFLNDQPLRYNSFFRAHGALAPAGAFNSMASMAVRYLELLGVAEERLLIKTNAPLAEELDPPCAAAVDTEKPGYYHWTYGDPELTGEGVTVAIRNETDGSYFDIGNVIIVYKNGRPAVAEWGFGEETLLTAVHSKKLPIYFANLPPRLRTCLADPVAGKYVDALATAGRMAALGVRCAERGAGAMLADYLRGGAYQSLMVLGKDLPEAGSDTRHTASYFEVSDDVLAEISDRFEYYGGRVNFLRSLIARGADQAAGPAFQRQIGLPPEMTRAILDRLTKGT